MTLRAFGGFIPWMAVGALIPLATAQVKGTTGTGGTGPTGTTTSRTTTTPNSTMGTTTTTSPTQLPPIFLSGRVTLEDGSPPPQSVRIERICGGSTHTDGFTDTSGNFNVEVGSLENAAYQDAGDSSSGGGLGQNSGVRSGGGLGGALTDRRLVNCDLRARLAGYRSQIIPLTERRPMDNPDVGTILLHREGAETGSTVSASSLAAPKDARKAFDKAEESMQKGKVDDAYKSYQKAVSLYRGYAAAWCQLGKIEAGSGRFDAARLSFGEAVKADAKFPDSYVELGALAVNDKKWQEAVDLTDQALKLNSFDYPLAWFDNAVANYNLNHMELAEQSALKTVRLDTLHKYPQVDYLEGLIRLNLKDYKSAAEHIRTYLSRAPDALDSAQAREQLAKLDALAAADSGK